MKILFIQTGGTIDKDYPHTTKGWAFEIGEPACKRILDKLNPSFEYEVVTSCQKDSLEITDNDRQDMVDIILKRSEKKVVITHGTDTMIETAAYLGERIKDKLVILTGAMRPEMFTNSDASINLGCAIGVANIVEDGVYIAMHGIVKHYLQIKRNLETGKYY